MKMPSYQTALIASCLLALCQILQAKEQTLPESVLTFFETNCYDCHSSDLDKGGLNLETLAFDPTDRDGLTRWSQIFDRVDHGEMPPKDEPEGKEVFLSEFEEVLHELSQTHRDTKGRVRSRRLNRIEFENTVHDLLGIDLPISKLLPEDASQGGFNNVAEAQPVSYHLLEKYMEVVDLSLDEAFRRATEPMPSVSHSGSPVATN